MATISIEVLGCAIALLSPIYAYLYTINQKLSKNIAVVENCPYCQRKIELVDIKRSRS